MHRTNSQPDTMTGQSKKTAGAESEVESRTEQRAAPTASIEALLATGDETQFVRGLLSGLAHGTFPPAGCTLAEWLAEANGARRMATASAFAHFPCFACRNGFESCD